MLKILFLAAFVLNLGYSRADQCVRGPTYWCKSIKNAKECNAFKHCLQTVWTTHLSYTSKKQLDTSNTPNTCSNCVHCLEADSSRCQFDKFQQEIQELKDLNLPSASICRLLEQCDDHKLVDHNQIEYNLDSRFKCGIHPRNWCDTLETAKRCDALDTCFGQWSRLKFKLKDSINSENPKLNSEKTCGFCLYIFQKLRQSILENATEINVRDYLEGACTLLPSQNLTDLCIKEVDSYLPEIYNMLRNNMDPGIICRVLKQCSDASLQLVAEPANEAISLLDSISLTVLNDKDVIVKTPIQINTELLSGEKSQTLVGELKRTMGVGCELCTIVMNAAKYMIESKTDNRKVLGFIEHQLCGRLGTLNSTCVEYVEQEGGEIIELLIKSVDPAVVCHAMGLCLKVQMDEEKFYDLNVRNPLNCTLCKVVFNQVRKMLADQKSQARILTYVDANLCQKIGKSREMCKTLIDAYGPLFLDIISRDVHPDQLCAMIGMCSSNTELVQQQTNTQNTQYCVMCEFLITVLEKYITQNSTIPEIETWMSYICQHVMPVSIRGECSDFVTAYGEIILNLITSQVPPHKVCTFIKVCNNSGQGPLFAEETDLFKLKNSLVLQKEKSAAERVQESRGMSMRCTVCQFAIQYISNEYSLDKTEKAVEFTISNVCKLIPRSYRAHCDSIIDKHGVRLLNFMDQYSEPVQVCSKIKICPIKEKNDYLVDMIEVVPAKSVQSQTKNEIGHVKEPVVLGNKTLQCSLCLYVAEVIDNKLKDNKTEEEITKELLLVCNLFPDSLKDQCSAFINEYGPYVIQLVASDLDPDVTCAALKLCEKTMERDLIKQAILKKLQN